MEDRAGALDELGLEGVVETDSTAGGRRLGSLLPEKATALRCHAVAVAALQQDALDILRGCDQGADLLQLTVHELSPGCPGARALWGGQESPNVGERHAETAAEANQHQAVDRFRTVLPLATDSPGLCKEAGVLVEADGGGPKPAGGGKLSDAQPGWV